MNLMDKGTNIVTAQKADGTLYQARYREAQNHSTLAGAVFVWEYKHYSVFAKLSKLIPKWRNVWQKGEPWVMSSTIRLPSDCSGI